MVQTYIMSGDKSNFTTKYSPSISLDPKKRYEAALLFIDLYIIPSQTQQRRTTLFDIQLIKVHLGKILNLERVRMN